MTKYPEIADISVDIVTDTILMYRESRYLKRRHRYDANISTSSMYTNILDISTHLYDTQKQTKVHVQLTHVYYGPMI